MSSHLDSLVSSMSLKASKEDLHTVPFSIVAPDLPFHYYELSYLVDSKYMYICALHNKCNRMATAH